MIERFSSDAYIRDLDRMATLRCTGVVTEMVGLLVESQGVADRTAPGRKP